jgi:hypothetical protein
MKRSKTTISNPIQYSGRFSDSRGKFAAGCGAKRRSRGCVSSSAMSLHGRAAAVLGAWARACACAVGTCRRSLSCGSRQRKVRLFRLPPAQSPTLSSPRGTAFATGWRGGLLPPGLFRMRSAGAQPTGTAILCVGGGLRRAGERGRTAIWVS